MGRKSKVVTQQELVAAAINAIVAIINKSSGGNARITLEMANEVGDALKVFAEHGYSKQFMEIMYCADNLTRDKHNPTKVEAVSAALRIVDRFPHQNDQDTWGALRRALLDGFKTKYDIISR